MGETKYQKLITSYHKPKFYDHISLITQPLIDVQNATAKLIDDFEWVCNWMPSACGWE